MTRLHSSAIGHVRLALQLPVTAPPALDCLLQQRVEVHFRRGIDWHFSNSSVNTGEISLSTLAQIEINLAHRGRVLFRVLHPVSIGTSIRQAYIY
jgi:hypothetical protein